MPLSNSPVFRSDANGRRAVRQLLCLAGVFALFFFLGGQAFAQVSPLDPPVSGALDSISLARSNWAVVLLDEATALFLVLASIELCWAAILIVLRQDGMTALTAAMVRRIMVFSFFFFILQNSGEWLGYLVTEMKNLADQMAPTTGLTVTEPNEIIDRGISISHALIERVNSVGLWSDVATSLGTLLVSLLILCSFTVVGALVAIVRIESFIVLSAGILFLALGGSRWTVDLTIRFITYAFSVGIKLFVQTLLLGACMSQTESWFDSINLRTATVDLYWPVMFEMLGGSLFFALLIWQVPKTLAKVFSGAPLSAAAAFRDPEAQPAPQVSVTPPPSPVIESVRRGYDALREGYEHYRDAGGGIVSSALRAVGNSTVDYSATVRNSARPDTDPQRREAPATAKGEEAVGGSNADTPPRSRPTEKNRDNGQGEEAAHRPSPSHTREAKSSGGAAVLSDAMLRNSIPSLSGSSVAPATSEKQGETAPATVAGAMRPMAGNQASAEALAHSGAIREAAATASGAALTETMAASGAVSPDTAAAHHGSPPSAALRDGGSIAAEGASRPLGSATTAAPSVRAPETPASSLAITSKPPESNNRSS